MLRFLRKYRRYLLAALAAVILVLATAPITVPALLRTEWAKHKTENLISESLERPVHLKGKLELELNLTPRLSFTEFVIENPPPLTKREMLSIGKFSISLPLLSLLKGSFDFLEVISEDVKIHLANLQAAEGKDARSNWDFSAEEPSEAKEDSEEATLPIIKKLLLSDVHMYIETGESPRKVLVESLLAENINLEQGSIDSSLQVDGIPITLKGGISSLIKFLEGEPLNIELDLKQNAHSLLASGTFRLDGPSDIRIVKAAGSELKSLSPLLGVSLPDFKDYSLSGLLILTPNPASESISIKDLKLKLQEREISGQIALELFNSGDVNAGLDLSFDSHRLAAKGGYKASGALDLVISASGKDLSELSAFALNELPPWRDYSIEGRLSSSSIDEGKFKLEDIKLNIEDSDLEGSIKLTTSPLNIEAKLQSKKFDLAAISSKAEAEQQKPEAEKSGDKGEEARIPFELLEALDADIELHAASLKSSANLESEDVVVSAKLKSGKLVIPKFTASAFGGAFNGSAQAAKEGFNLKLNAQRLDANSLAQLAGSKPILDGAFNFDVDLRGKGDVTSEILKTLSGSVNINSDNAKLKSSPLQTAASGLTEILAPIFGDSQQAKSECILFNYEIKNGIAKSKEQVIKLKEIFIFAKGELDFPKNKLSYDFNVASSKPALASLIPPFQAFGKLSSPYFAPSISGSVGAISDSGEKLVGAAAGLAEQAASLVIEIDQENLSGLAVCKEAYNAEQKLISSRIGKFLTGERAPVE